MSLEQRAKMRELTDKLNQAVAALNELSASVFRHYNEVQQLKRTVAELEKKRGPGRPPKQ